MQSYWKQNNTWVYQNWSRYKQTNWFIINMKEMFTLSGKLNTDYVVI